MFNLDNALHNTLSELNENFNTHVSQVPDSPIWLVLLQDSADTKQIHIELKLEDGGIVASVLDRHNVSYGRLAKIMDTLLNNIILP